MFYLRNIKQSLLFVFSVDHAQIINVLLTIKSWTNKAQGVKKNIERQNITKTMYISFNKHKSAN